jgi:hypothetical protein
MTQGFDDEYAAALRTYLQTRSEKDLAVGNELGRGRARYRCSRMRSRQSRSCPF